MVTFFPSATRRRPSTDRRQNIAAFDGLAFTDDRTLVDAGGMVGTFVFDQGYSFSLPPAVLTMIFRSRRIDGAVFFADDGHAGVLRRLSRFRSPRTAPRSEAGDRLPLHVRSHQGAVGIVMLEKGMQAVETETICFGETSTKSTISFGTSKVSPPKRATTMSSTISFFSLTLMFAWAM